MSDFDPTVSLPPGWQVLTPEDQAVRAEFAEITGEDPRSYKREVEYRAEHPRRPVQGRSILGALKRALTEGTDQ